MAEAQTAANQPRSQTSGAWLLLFAAVVVALYVRVRLLSMPMERDEGEYAYVGQLILQGGAPYRDAYSLKWPGAHLAYAFIMAIFGQTDSGIRFGLLLVNAVSTASLFFLAKRLWGQLPAIFAASLFVLWSLSPVLLGTMAHATQFLVACCVPAYLLLLRGLETRRIGTFAACGFLLGLALLMKQHAVFFVLHACAVVLWTERGNLKSAAGRVAVILAAAMVPFALVCLYFLITGGLDRFWFWTITYARAYTVISSPAVAWKSLINALAVLRWDGPLWLLSFMGLGFLWLRKLPHRGLVTGFFLAALATVIPGFYFRQHYWVTVTPAAALLAGVALWQFMKSFEGHRAYLVRRLPFAALGCVLTYFFLVFGGVFFVVDPDEASKRLYPQEDFPALKAVGLRLRKVAPGAKIAVLGSEPQLYFYSNHRAATGFLYTFPLVENQPYAIVMQHQMVDEVTKAAPQALVYVQTERSWFPQPGFNPFIINWVFSYTKGYVPIELVDLGAPGDPVIAGERLRTYQPTTQEFITTLVKPTD